MSSLFEAALELDAKRHGFPKPSMFEHGLEIQSKPVLTRSDKGTAERDMD
jgi:hypothetical protein